jgi:cob(I)alamin adenosyltransferase
MFDSLMERGLIQVYTGNGKGKTTAALGVALRAVGNGLRVMMVQFMKGNVEYGEQLSAPSLSPSFTLIQTGRNVFVSKSHLDPQDIKCAEEGFFLSRQAIESKEYDIVILDEINMAVDYGLISLSDLLQLIESKPDTVALILTGRNARSEVLDKADLVTEMVERKHYFNKGVPPRKGIEY